jgi:hypothetical protein
MAIGHVLSRAPEWVKSQSLDSFLITIGERLSYRGEGTKNRTLFHSLAGSIKRQIKNFYKCENSV